MHRHHLTVEDIAARYPRLIKLLKWQGCLSTGEAVCGLYCYERGIGCGTEAVAHYGGMPRLLADALRNRHHGGN